MRAGSEVAVIGLDALGHMVVKLSRAQEETNQKAFERGRADRLAGKTESPYPPESPYHLLWQRGFQSISGNELPTAVQDREVHLHELAERLLFSVVKAGDRFTLTRTADVSRPVREEDLTLAEAEKLVETWKLRGPHGG